MTPNDTSDQFISAPPAFDDIPKDQMIQPVPSQAMKFLSLPPDEQHRLFKKFTKREAAITGAIAGGGLGVSLFLKKFPKPTSFETLVRSGGSRILTGGVLGAGIGLGAHALLHKESMLNDLGFSKISMIRTRQNVKSMIPRVNMKKIGFSMSRMNPAIGNTMMSSNTKRQHAPGTKIVGAGSNRRLFSRGNVAEFN